MLISFILLYLLFYIKQAENPDSSDKSFFYLLFPLIKASAIWMLYLYCLTEILSLFHLLSFAPILTAWAVFSTLLFSDCFYTIRKKRTDSRHFPLMFRELAAIFAICLPALILSVLTVPYNWDSMTYHLPRIAHWAQNGSVAHYSTNIVRQITSPVLAEFINLHVYILTGHSDILFHLLQSISYLLCAVVIYGIANKLSCSPLFCFLASLLFVSTPIAFAEALTTQVDLFATLWLLYFTYVILDFMDNKQKISFDRNTIAKVCLLGIFVAFGYLAKPSVCIAMVIMVLALLIVCIRRRDSWNILLRLISCVIPFIVLPILPELIRNLKTFSAISAPIAGQRQLVGSFHPCYLFINFLKNFVYNLPSRYLPESAAFLQKIVLKIASILHVDINAASISENGQFFIMHTPPNYAHDTAINPLILFLTIGCIIPCILNIRKHKISEIRIIYSLSSIISFLVFCVLLRWEPYVTRYMVSYLALFCPVIASHLQGEKHFCLPVSVSPLFRIRVVLYGIICFFCITDLYGMINYHKNICIDYNAAKRPYGYFVNRTTDWEPYRELCDYIIQSGCREVGLYTNEDHYEYPFWAMLDSSVSRIDHILVSNASAVYSDSHFTPDCIIWLEGTPPCSTVTVNNAVYDILLQTTQEKYYLLIRRP